MYAKMWIISTSTFNLYLKCVIKRTNFIWAQYTKRSCSKNGRQYFCIEIRLSKPGYNSWLQAQYQLSQTAVRENQAVYDGGEGGFYSGRNTIVMLRLKRFKDSKRSRSFWSRTRSWQRHILNRTHYNKVSE